MKNHYFQMDDRALWSELRSGSLIALEVIYTSNPQLSSSASFLRLNVLSSLN